MSSAARINGPLAADVIETARDAFTASLALVAAVCTVLVLATGAIVLFALRRSVSPVELQGEV